MAGAPRPELLPLQYPTAWQEILTVPEAVDYRDLLASLVATTCRACQGAPEAPSWASHPESVANRWHRAVELVAGAIISPEYQLTEPQIVRAGLAALKFNLAYLGWEEEGLAFVVPDILTGEATCIDLREVQGPIET